MLRPCLHALRRRLSVGASAASAASALLFVLPLLLGVGTGGWARADTVTCYDGRVYEGEVLEDGKHTVRVRTAQGSITLPRAEVKSVEYKEGPFQIARKRRVKLASDDAKGRWELSEYCIQHEQRRLAAQLLRELRSMASPYYIRATRRLADLAAAKNPKRAVQLLDELIAKSGDLEAKIKAKEIKRALDAKRRKAYDEALAAIQAKRWGPALATLRYAYQLSYPGVRGGGGGEKTRLSEEAILAKMAEVRRGLEQRVRRPKPAPGSKTAASNPKPLDCPRCDQHTGWGVCPTCNGTGKVDHIIPAIITLKRVIPARRVKVTCPTCHGTKKSRCPRCLGSTLDLTRVNSRTRYVVKYLADLAWTRRNNDPLRAMKTVAGRALYRKLKLPEGYRPSYPGSKALRDLLPGVPVDPGFAKTPAYGKFLQAWKSAPRRVRGSFLSNYAFEVARSALAGAGEGGGGEVEPVAPDEHLDWKKLRLTAPAISATELSAMPEERAGEWLWVDAAYEGKDETLGGKNRIGLKIKTKWPHNLHPFLFLSGAKKVHAAAAKDAHAPPFLKILAAQYPYDEISRKAAALKPGDRLRLFGRALYRKSRDPETALEVWTFEVHADEETEKLLERVRQPVTFHFQNTPLREAMELLSLLTDTKIRVDVPPGAEVALNARATKHPLAFALRKMLKPAKLRWVFDGKSGGLKVVQNATPEESAKLERVLQYLK